MHHLPSNAVRDCCQTAGFKRQGLKTTTQNAGMSEAHAVTVHKFRGTLRFLRVSKKLRVASPFEGALMALLVCGQCCIRQLGCHCAPCLSLFF